MPVIKSFASVTNSCADKVFDHKILNRSDVAKSYLVETSDEGNCKPVLSSDIGNSMEINQNSSHINQADIDTTNPNKTEDSTSQESSR